MTSLTAEGVCTDPATGLTRSARSGATCRWTQWNDWHWQMRHRITTAEELARVVPMTPSEQRTIERALDRFRFAVPPYYASLIDPDDPSCPIRLQAVPGEGELTVGDFDIEDPLNEEGDAVAPGHDPPLPGPGAVGGDARVRHAVPPLHPQAQGRRARRPDHRRASSTPASPTSRRTREVRDVLLSGGDPFLLSDDRIEHILGAAAQRGAVGRDHPHRHRGCR